MPGAGRAERGVILSTPRRRHRGLKASIDDNDRDVVAGALAGSRSVVMAAALDIVGTLESMKGKLEVCSRALGQPELPVRCRQIAAWPGTGPMAKSTVVRR